MKAGAVQRDAAIERALTGAGQDWAVRATFFLKQYAQHREFVTAEDVRAFAAGYGLEAPREVRAWGGVMQAAARLGWIEKAGYVEAKTPHAHCRPSTLWRSTLTNKRGGCR